MVNISRVSLDLCGNFHGPIKDSNMDLENVNMQERNAIDDARLAHSSERAETAENVSELNKELKLKSGFTYILKK